METEKQDRQREINANDKEINSNTAPGMRQHNALTGIRGWGKLLD